jgi:Tol biopolymer transport system component
MNADGSGVQRVSPANTSDYSPAWSPRENWIALASGSGKAGGTDLHVMNRDGSGLRQLTQGKWTDTMAHWSPTGEWIAFASDRDGNFDLWLIHPDGSGLRKLIGGGGRNTHPHFSPDGRWIVFTSQRAGYSAEESALPTQPQPYGDLFAMRLDGSGLVRLFHNAFEEGTPAWGPALEIKPSAEGRNLGGVDY